MLPLDARAIFERARGRSVLVVGDVMLDEWIWGTVSRISPEAPVPVVAVERAFVYARRRRKRRENLRALGAEVYVCGDGWRRRVRARKFARCCDDAGVDGGGIVALDDRPTTRKTRVVAHHQQVVRADWEATRAAAGGRARPHRGIRARTRAQRATRWY